MSVIQSDLQPVALAVREPRHRTLRVAYTPDSDDVLNFYAWKHRRMEVEAPRAEFHQASIITLNRSCLRGQYDVAAVSSAFYPQIAHDYWILSCGTSTGRGYGPVLVALDEVPLTALAGKVIAVGGHVTTGSALAAMYCPNSRLVEMRFDQIAQAILAKEVDAGVMIHEELLHYPQEGLHRVCDLGATWCEETGGPLPVGLNVVHKRVGVELAHRIDAACRASLQWSLDHLDEALAHARTFGRGCSDQFVSMFSNADTLSMPSDVEQALPLVFDRVATLGLGPRIGKVEVIRGL